MGVYKSKNHLDGETMGKRLLTAEVFHREETVIYRTKECRVEAIDMYVGGECEDSFLSGANESVTIFLKLAIACILLTRRKCYGQRQKDPR